MPTLVENIKQAAAPGALSADVYRLRDTARRFSCETMLVNPAGFVDSFTDPATGQTFLPETTLGEAVSVGGARPLRGYKSNPDGSYSFTGARQGIVVPVLPWRGQQIVHFMSICRFRTDIGGPTLSQHVFADVTNPTPTTANATQGLLELRAINSATTKRIGLAARHSSAAETPVEASLTNTGDWLLLRGFVDYAGNRVGLTNVATGETAFASGDPAIWGRPAGNPSAGHSKLFGQATDRPSFGEHTDFCFWSGPRPPAKIAVIDEMMRARRRQLG